MTVAQVKMLAQFSVPFTGSSLSPCSGSMPLLASALSLQGKEEPATVQMGMFPPVKILLMGSVYFPSWGLPAHAVLILE